jgi:hypothetical protein
MKTLTEIIAQTKKLMPDHYETLLGERKAGSQWGRPFTEDDFNLPWEEDLGTGWLPLADPARNPDCRYFRLKPSREWFPEATVGATRIDELGDAMLSAVRVENGPHGLQLVCAGAWGRIETNEAWLIVGEHEGREVVFTAHPGAPLPPLNAKTAVKVV